MLLILFLLSSLCHAIERSFTLQTLSPDTFTLLGEQDKRKRDEVVALFNDPARVKDAMHACRLALLAFQVFFSVMLAGNVFSTGSLQGLLLVASTATLAVACSLLASRLAARPLSCRRLCGLAPLITRMVKHLPGLDPETGSPRLPDTKEKDGILLTKDLDEALAIKEHQQTTGEKQDILKRVLRFSRETVGEVMTPRANIVGVSADCSYEELLKTAVDNSFSRIPVFRADTSDDQITGVLYVKDLLPYIHGNKSLRKWQELIRPPFYVPESKKIDSLLHEFQSQKLHIAVVIDEYGSTSGLITMEDILEEIVGEINDEYDEEERTYTRIDNRRYVFKAQTPLSVFFDVFGAAEELENVSGEAETLAGLLLELCDGLPSPHQRIVHGRFIFEVLDMDERHIVTIKVTLHNADKAHNPVKPERQNP